MNRLTRGLRSLGVHDYFVGSYLLFLNAAVLRSPPGPVRTTCLLHVGGLLAAFAIAMVVVRGSLIKPGFWPALLYRLGIYGTVQLSYFFFKDLLPHVNPRALDAELYQLDLMLFGIEPALWMDRFVTPATTEWFAFFYFWYFFLLAAHIFPILLAVRDLELLGEFTLGMLILFCVGHTVYILVPGFGPYRAMADAFENQFPHGLWLDLVMSAVNSGGAMKDIFPSLHTAGPTFIALMSFRNRKRVPFTYTWPLITFFAGNIILATMFLRWHYIIDVVAGLALATFAALASPVITRWELRRRAREGLLPLWPLFVPDAQELDAQRRAEPRVAL